MNPRTIILPLLTLVVAGGIYLWSRERTSSSDDAVAAFVAALVEAVMAEPPQRPDLGATDPLIEEDVRTRLDALGETARSRGTRPVWRIEHGDPDGPGDRSASHTVTVELDRVPVLVLRIRHEGGSTPPAVVGVLSPDPASDT